MKLSVLVCLILMLVFGYGCARNGPSQPASGPVPDPVKINGLTLVAPPRPFSTNPILPVQAVGANWIAVVPYAFTRPGEPMVWYNGKRGQWWGERPEGVLETIRLAHEAGVQVMLKPQIYVPRSWTGSLNFDTAEDWASWEQGYERYILEMARLADTCSVGLFCIGTEFRMSVARRPAFWKSLITKVRQVYRGKLVYSANWDDWEQVPFWPELDYIGLSGYFPLIQAATPQVDSLKAAWEPICQRLRTFSRKHQRPVLFTEFGYLSVDHCGWRNWELEAVVREKEVNEQAQANCLEALLATFQPEPWWAGGFVWKWFPELRGHEGYPERDYTPQGKAGEAILCKWYGG